MRGPIRARLGSVLVVVLVLVAVVGVGAVVVPPVVGALPTYGNDDLRTGWYPDQVSLGPGVVTGGSFGQLFRTVVQGQVYGQPLVSGNTLLVTTEDDWVYGLDPVSGAVRWQRNVGTGWNASDLSCADLVPHIGITGTPVVDEASGRMYFFAKSYVSGTAGPAQWFAHAVSVSDGSEVAGWPVAVAGTAANAPAVSFDATHQMQRPGLLLMNGVVYAAFGAHCDAYPYQGWIVGVSTAGVLRPLWTDTDTTGGSAGIWQSGSGIMSDQPGRMFVVSGNGKGPAAPTPGNTPPAACSECVLRVDVASDGSLAAKDFFRPYDADHLDTIDADFGSGGVVELPTAQFGTVAHPRVAVSVGKEGYVYVLDADNLGGYKQGLGGGDGVLNRVGPDGGVWSKPTVWPGDGGYVYVVTGGGNLAAAGSSGKMNAYKYGLDTAGLPSLSLVGSSTDSFGFGSSPPVVTSDATTSGSALVWVVWSASGTGANAQLRAYQPVPQSGKMVPVWSAPIGTSAKFNPPGIGGNRVYVGTRDGAVYGFGSPNQSPLTGSAATFAATVVGSSRQQTVTLTAHQDITVTGVAANPAVFAATPPVLPATLHLGDTLSVPVSFSPTVVGTISGQLAVTTNVGEVDIGLSGVGQSSTAQLVALPPAISFGGQAIGSVTSTNALLSNTGAAALTITAITGATAPFSLTPAPVLPITVNPGTSVSLAITYTPTVAGTFTAAVAITTTGGNAVINLSGAAATPAHMTVSNPTLDFGSVATTSSLTKNFDIINTGGTSLTITKSKPPTNPAFTVTAAVPEATVVPPGGHITASVSFNPTIAGPVTDSWTLNGTGDSTLTTVTITGTGAVPPPFEPPPPGHWQLNGSTTLAPNGDLILTPAVGFQAGSAFWPHPINTTPGFSIGFDAVISNGTGGDGLTLALADPATATPTALGANGSGEGWAGIAGIAVSLDTYQNDTDPSNNFAGIAIGSTTGTYGPNITYGAVSPTTPNLRDGQPHHVQTTYDGATLTVTIDGGTPITRGGLELPRGILIGFTAGTGMSYQQHLIRNVTLGSGFAPVAPARILDTRDGTGGPATPFGPGAIRSLAVTAPGIPATGVTAVVVNVTVTDPTSSGYLTAYPSDLATPPLASNLNFTAGQTIANLVTVKVGADGKIKLFNRFGTTAVIADIVGWYGPTAGSKLTAANPARILDTRDGTGGPATPFGAGTIRSVAIAGQGGVPATGVTAVVVNVTITNPTASGYLTAYPSDLATPPLASNLNFTAGQTIPNLVTVKVGADGKIKLFNPFGSTAVIADVVGWYAAAGAWFNPVPPARILDTRDGTGGPATPFGPGTIRNLDVTGPGGTPATAVTAVVINITITGPTGPGYLTLYPSDLATPPLASNLNFTAGETIPNLVVVKAGADGTVKIFNPLSTTAVVGDVVGWFG